jgi:A/G-specific adenine glycosylase
MSTDGSVNPYAILVSEVMLQQTQVDRVIPKFTSFMQRFPSVAALARTPLSEVLIAWQGLGYNRRGKLLQQAAQMIVEHYQGKVPETPQALQELPGVGPYIAGAVAAFAYNYPSVIIETNIRTVYTHHFFTEKTEVSDAQLLPIIAQTLDQKNPRAWYAALMDYGSFLKKSGIQINAVSTTYVKQKAFKGSDRQIRGAIVRTLATHPACTKRKLHLLLSDFERSRVDAQLVRLVHEGLLVSEQRKFRLAPR